LYRLAASRALRVEGRWSMGLLMESCEGRWSMGLLMESCEAKDDTDPCLLLEVAPDTDEVFCNAWGNICSKWSLDICCFVCPLAQLSQYFSWQSRHS
jgi:hypothetical protein